MGIGFLHGNGTMHLLKGRFVPFITGRIGGTFIVDEPAFTYNYGGGLKVFITEKIALRFDYRELQTELEGEIQDVNFDKWFSSTDEIHFSPNNSGFITANQYLLEKQRIYQLPVYNFSANKFF